MKTQTGPSPQRWENKAGFSLSFDFFTAPPLPKWKQSRTSRYPLMNPAYLTPLQTGKLQ